jgi:hypothetical protein
VPKGQIGGPLDGYRFERGASSKTPFSFHSRRSINPVKRRAEAQAGPPPSIMAPSLEGRVAGAWHSGVSGGHFRRGSGDARRQARAKNRDRRSGAGADAARTGKPSRETQPIVAAEMIYFARCPLASTLFRGAARLVLVGFVASGYLSQLVWIMSF